MKNVRLIERSAGNFHQYTVMPGGEWHGMAVSWDGTCDVSKLSTQTPVLALANTGNWSGGGCLRGWVFGMPGAIVFFGCKGAKRWLVFSEAGPAWSDTRPGDRGKEL